MKLLKAGDRIELLDMPDDPCPITAGTKGTVVSNTVDPCDRAEHLISVDWDNGRKLGLCSKVDRAMKLEKIMANLTYRELQAHLATMDDEQLNSNVTIHVTEQDEFMPCQALDYVSEDGNGILDPYHPFLIMEP